MLVNYILRVTVDTKEMPRTRINNSISNIIHYTMFMQLVRAYSS